MRKKENILFLLGSGISIPAGLPSTNDITKAILTEENIYERTDSTYGPFDITEHFEDFEEIYSTEISIVKQIQVFLSLLGSEVYKYYVRKGKVKQVNYEDLYYAASQIADSESSEYDNPVVQSFIDKMFDKIEFSGESTSTLLQLADKSIKYIRDRARSKLWKDDFEAEYLKIFEDAANDERIDEISVGTLNHDLLLDRYFRNSNFDLVDGFNDPVHTVRWWNPKRYEEKHKFYFYKLHGSINWYRFYPSPENEKPDPLAILNGKDYGLPYWAERVGSTDVFDDPVRDENNRRMRSTEPRPLILVGTFNKMFEYTTNHIFAHLLYMFRERLNKTSKLIISGYGFGDKGINALLIDWIFSGKKGEKKVLIIHSDPSRLRENSRGAIDNKWDALVKEGVFIFIENWFNEISWNNITNKLLNDIE